MIRSESLFEVWSTADVSADEKEEGATTPPTTRQKRMPASQYEFRTWTN